ncbi:hypothetical protein EB093_04955 [bacterium]|nr:hypothetical protein [bacterium]
MQQLFLKALSSAVQVQADSHQWNVAYRPIYYDSMDAYDILESKKIDALGSKISFKNGRMAYQVDLASIESHSFFNPVNDAISWDIESSIGYDDTLFTFQKLQVGWTFVGPFLGAYTGLIGGTVGNYDDALNAVQSSINLRPAALLQMKFKLNPALYSYVSFDYRGDRHFVNAGVSQKMGNDSLDLGGRFSSNWMTMTMSLIHRF